MAREKTEKKKIRWYQKLKWKYRLVIMHDETLEERLTFRLTRLNVFIASGLLTIILIILTTILIAFTPLREYIPGYTNVGLQKDLYELQLKTDSIEKDLIRKDLFIQNLRNIISGDLPVMDTSLPYGSDNRYQQINFSRSVEDSLLRLEVENQTKYSLYQVQSLEQQTQRKYAAGNMLFFSPIKGIITNEFDPRKQHYGIDIAAQKNETVKSVLDGTVILSNWTVETGYVISIQHPHSIVSVYKHNSALLKQTGERVKAGEVIAIVGETGEYTTGTHLHFELWDEGNPVNPKDYISF